MKLTTHKFLLYIDYKNFAQIVGQKPMTYAEFYVRITGHL